MLILLDMLLSYNFSYDVIKENDCYYCHACHTNLIKLNIYRIYTILCHKNINFNLETTNVICHTCNKPMIISKTIDNDNIFIYDTRYINIVYTSILYKWINKAHLHFCNTGFAKCDHDIVKKELYINYNTNLDFIDLLCDNIKINYLLYDFNLTFFNTIKKMSQNDIMEFIKYYIDKDKYYQLNFTVYEKEYNKIVGTFIRYNININQS